MTLKKNALVYFLSLVQGDGVLIYTATSHQIKMLWLSFYTVNGFM